MARARSAEVLRVHAERDDRTTARWRRRSRRCRPRNIEVSCQYIGGGFGSKFTVDRWGLDLCRAVEEGRPARQAHARARSGAADRRHAPVDVRARSRSAATPRATSRRGSRRFGARRAWRARMPGPQVIPYVFVGIPNSKRIGQRIADQRRSVARLARAESSAGGRDHDDRARRSRGGAQDGSARLLHQESGAHRATELHDRLSRRSIAKS